MSKTDTIDICLINKIVMGLGKSNRVTALISYDPSIDVMVAQAMNRETSTRTISKTATYPIAYTLLGLELHVCKLSPLGQW